MVAKHIEGPWEVMSLPDGCGGCRTIAAIRLIEGELSTDEIAITAGYYDDEIDKANAEFIVRACNSYYDMMEALKAASFAIGFAPETNSNEAWINLRRKIDKVIDKATKEES